MIYDDFTEGHHERVARHYYKCMGRYDGGPLSQEAVIFGYKQAYKMGLATYAPAGFTMSAPENVHRDRLTGKPNPLLGTRRRYRQAVDEVDAAGE